MKPPKINIPTNNQKYFLSAIALVIVFTLISGCNFPPGKTSNSQINLYQERDLTTAPINIELNLTVPQAITAKERILLELLDEVSGIPHNINRYDMEQVNDLEYRVQLLVPSFSVIKYRYVKFDGFSYQVEHHSYESPARYRLFYANKSDEAKDILYSWGDTPSITDTGRLQGQILDEVTKAPISDILVSAGAKLVISDTNGKFVIDGLVPGQQNVVFYAPDGQYQTYQQDAIIVPRQTTPATLELKPMTPINVSFRVTPPQDALGAPVHIAGNLIQLGNTFTDLTGSMSINPKSMPQLILQEDGTLSIDLIFYSGSDLRYKFTLGDGFWNAEQELSGGFRVRQLIIPEHDITVDLVIESWRTAGFEPITFQITIPPEQSPHDEKFIQFKIREWTEPIPLWPLGGGNYLYILFSPFSKDDLISYRFCRNADCIHGLNDVAQSSLVQIQPKREPQTINVEIQSWANWQSNDSILDFTPSPTPYENASYKTIVELSPKIDSYWHAYAPGVADNLSRLGANTVIFTPQWAALSDAPLFHPEIGLTPLSQHLSNLIEHAQKEGLETGIFPQLRFRNTNTFWTQSLKSDHWWDEWFESYGAFLNNYAKMAELTGSNYLLIGGNDVLPAFSGGIYLDEPLTDLPEDSDRMWRDLFLDLRKTFSGDLIWVTRVGQKADPLPEFVHSFDGIYIIVDSPLSTAEEPDFDEIANGFTNIVDQYIYEIYRSTELPLFIGLGYPSADRAASGCLLINDRCNNDGIFLSDEVESIGTNLSIQKLIYEAILPVIASRPWIEGTSIRGYDPIIVSHDQTSSIAGKPAEAVISDWFTRINSQ